MEKVKGKVIKISPVSKNRVQFEFDGVDKVFELFIDQSWVMNVGDSVFVAGKSDDTGKFIAYAYSNQSKGVKGWKCASYSSIALLFGVSIVGFLFYFALASVFMRSNASAIMLIGFGVVGVFFFLRKPVSDFVLFKKSKSACS